MVNWFCSAALCCNSFRTRNASGLPIHFYRLPRDPAIQQQYKSILKTDGINFSRGHICVEHWSSGKKKSNDDIPDIAAPPSHFELFEKKLKCATKRFSKMKEPTQKQKENLKSLQRKVEIIRSYQQQQQPSPFQPPTSTSRRSLSTPRKNPISETPRRQRELSKRELRIKLAKDTLKRQSVQVELNEAKEKIAHLTSKNLAQRFTINSLKRQVDKKLKHDCCECE